MAKTVTIAGATYSDVPAIDVPVSGGGTASFVDTSDATATASDIALGKTAYVGGELVTGTASGGSSSKYGISLDYMFGDVDGNGVMSPPDDDTDIDLNISGFTGLGAYALYYKFYRIYAIKTATFSTLTNADQTYGAYACFGSCSYLTSISFPVLASVGGSSAFVNLCSSCTRLTSASFPALTEVDGNSAFQGAFSGCSKLTSVDFSALQTIGNPSTNSTTYRQFYTAFNNCSLLTSITFPALTAIYCNGTAASYGTFYSNQKVEKFYFPSLTYIGLSGSYSNQTGLKNVFGNSGNLTELHFAAANRSAIESCTGYDTLWGATNATAYFDL